MQDGEANFPNTELRTRDHQRLDFAEWYARVGSQPDFDLPGLISRSSGFDELLLNHCSMSWLVR